MKSLENNPNIGVLGGADYQKDNDRIKGFCGNLVDHPDNYRHHLENFVLPLIAEFNPSRVIDRVLIREGVDINQALEGTNLLVEATIKLGGKWEGYNWMMLGRNSLGRRLSKSTSDAASGSCKTQSIPLNPMPPLVRNTLLNIPLPAYPPTVI